MPIRKSKIKKKPTGHVTVDEQLEMKVLLDTGHTKTEICEATGRGYRAVAAGIKKFDYLLVGDNDLYDKFETERDKFIERMVQNSAALIMASDQQTANVLHEASAIEAANISKIHAARLDGIKNLSVKGLSEDNGKSPRVINFINQVFNIKQEDVRFETAPGT